MSKELLLRPYGLRNRLRQQGTWTLFGFASARLKPCPAKARIQRRSTATFRC